jgi:hypothetical protein
LDRLVRANPRAIAFSVQPSFRPRSTISKPRTKDDDEDDDEEEEMIDNSFVRHRLQLF